MEVLYFHEIFPSCFDRDELIEVINIKLWECFVLQVTLDFCWNGWLNIGYLIVTVSKYLNIPTGYLFYTWSCGRTKLLVAWSGNLFRLLGYLKNAVVESTMPIRSQLGMKDIVISKEVGNREKGPQQSAAGREQWQLQIRSELTSNCLPIRANHLFTYPTTASRHINVPIWGMWDFMFLTVPFPTVNILRKIDHKNGLSFNYKWQIFLFSGHFCWNLMDGFTLSVIIINHLIFIYSLQLLWSKMYHLRSLHGNIYHLTQYLKTVKMQNHTKTGNIFQEGRRSECLHTRG